MASITRRGNSFVVRYTYTDEKGKVCAGWETCKTETEANKRKREIEYELDKGTFLIPSDMTVCELLEKWIDIQSSKHRWAPKTYQSTKSSIQNLICPYIGDVSVQALTQYRIEEFYSMLAQTPCGQYVQGQRKELSPKQQKRLLSGTTLHSVHWILKSACAYALEWGIIQKSPIPHDAPKKTTKERAIWSESEMAAALDAIEDPMLHLAVHLTVVGSLRMGELLGIKPEDLSFDAAEGRGLISINKSMQRVGKEALKRTDPQLIIYEFPDYCASSASSLILKTPKNKHSVRHIFMTEPLKQELRAWLDKLRQDEEGAPEKYQNCGMLFRLPTGRPVEQTLLRKWFEQWEDAHPEFGQIVFHALRHSSATYQLRISDGNIKAVQGNTGHASADMLVNTYAHMQEEPRLALSYRFEDEFYHHKAGDKGGGSQPATVMQVLTCETLLEIVRAGDPETRRELARALFA